MEEKKIPYAWIDVDEDAEGLRLIKSVNNGNRTTPTIFVEGGVILFEPTNDELSEKVGL